MTSHDKHAQVLAALLAALAGYVDAMGFLALGGFFVSFMSGNSTRMGVGLAQGSDNGMLAAGLIAAFLCGVVIGALSGHLARSHRRAVTLALVAGLLAGSAAFGAHSATAFAATLMAMAMGVENNVFERNGEVSLGVTYMTGSLVKLGQRIAAALLGKDRFGWLSYLSLWLSFVIGVASGATAYSHAGLTGLWGASLVAAALAVNEWHHENSSVRTPTRRSARSM